MAEIELPLRSSTAASGSQHDRCRHTRQSTIAGVREQLDELQPRPETTIETRSICRSKVALGIYTFIRVVANLCTEGLLNFRSIDAVMRPLVTGFGVYWFLDNNRYSRLSRLHLWSWRLMLLLAFCGCDPAFFEFVEKCFYSLAGEFFTKIVMPWEVLCNVIQVHMTNLKLEALGWRVTARRLNIIAFVGVGIAAASSFLFTLTETWGFSFSRWFIIYGIWVSLLFFAPLVVLCQCYVLVRSAIRALVLAKGDASLRSTGWCLLANAVLVLVGPCLSLLGLIGLVLYRRESESLTNPLLITADVSLQVLNGLLLSGLLAPRSWDKPMETFQKLAEVSGYGLASKRIAFPGLINKRAKNCIVSFPGKYAQEWDEAVSVAKDRKRLCSLACVFFTNEASGLGQHSQNADMPEQCWCRALYGQLPAEVYLSIIDANKLTEEEIQFKQDDARAMGQKTIMKRDQGEIEWYAEHTEALREAEAKCTANSGLAPWGCQWFEKWRQNVKEAVALNQTLYVFYFKDMVSRGKMEWNQLCDDDAKQQTRIAGSGLGASQTAEVAYLDKMGYPYVELDITEFKQFVERPDEFANRSFQCPSP